MAVSNYFPLKEITQCPSELGSWSNVIASRLRQCNLTMNDPKTDNIARGEERFNT